MYHYYVRFSSYFEGEKVREGCVEVTLRQEITQMSHIEHITNTILKDTKCSGISPIDQVLIDFYQLLRKE